MTGTKFTNNKLQMTDTATKTTGIGVIFGLWNRYIIADPEAEDFYSKYDVEEYGDDKVFPLLTIIWDDVMTEIDSEEHDYPRFPSEWTEGVAALEANHAYFEVNGVPTSTDQLTTDGIKLYFNGEEYEAEDWDVQEIEEAIDIATGKEIALWG